MAGKKTTKQNTNEQTKTDSAQNSPEAKTQPKRSHEDRVNPLNDHPTGHLGYGRSNLKDVVDTTSDDAAET